MKNIPFLQERRRWQKKERFIKRAHSLSFIRPSHFLKVSIVSLGLNSSLSCLGESLLFSSPRASSKRGNKTSHFLLHAESAKKISLSSSSYFSPRASSREDGILLSPIPNEIRFDLRRMEWANTSRSSEIRILWKEREREREFRFLWNLCWFIDQGSNIVSNDNDLRIDRYVCVCVCVFPQLCFKATTWTVSLSHSGARIRAPLWSTNKRELCGSVTRRFVRSIFSLCLPCGKSLTLLRTTDNTENTSLRYLFPIPIRVSCNRVEGMADWQIDGAPRIINGLETRFRLGRGERECI